MDLHWKFISECACVRRRGNFETWRRSMPSVKRCSICPSQKRKFAWCQCTPLMTMYMLCEKIKVIQLSTNALGHLRRRRRRIMMTRKILSRVWKNSRAGETKVYMSSVGIGIAKEGAASDSDFVSIN